ncbi:MAG: MotA/TolQ/ExbB proton channel family protein [Spirochaetales bacterium]|nr:MotA/TolQ/ExbB proton channel family protein [Spirochaetales bacterium]
MIEFFLKGGLLMFPLLLCSLASIAVMVNRGLVYWFNRKNAANLTALENIFDKRISDSLFPAAGKISGSVRLLIECALNNRHLSTNLLEKKISHTGSLELKRLARFLHLLELIGRISPMIGLLGTILGLTGTFQSVSALKQAANPSILANGIWEALITTVAGLFVGIPALIFHHFYENTVNNTAFDMKQYAEKTVQLLKEDGTDDRI